MQNTDGNGERSGAPRRKKKKRFGYYLYSVTLFILTVANILLAVFLLTYVQRIKVTGIHYGNEEEIISLVTKDPLSANSLYAVLKAKISPVKPPAYAESVSVTFEKPWALKLKVKEKKVTAAFFADEKYYLIAGDGTIMSVTGKPPKDVTAVGGFTLKEPAVFSKVKVKEKNALTCAVDISEALTKIERKADSVLYEDGSLNVYFGGVCVRLGKSGFEEKLAQAMAVLPEIEGKKGILELAHYSQTTESISFIESGAGE